MIYLILLLLGEGVVFFHTFEKLNIDLIWRRRHNNRRALRERGGHSCGGFDHHSTHFWRERKRPRGGEGSKEGGQAGSLHNATSVPAEEQSLVFFSARQKRSPSYSFCGGEDDLPPGNWVRLKS